MYLKRIELVGFKSFASKTVLEFPAGIAAIVGPNGSGKSNIIDAVRWLLGEREAKNMRGAKAEDLIFAGTPQRARVGVAQATMVFDNANRFFPVDYAEVAIRRRIERDGTSQYFLNDAEVRLKDIIDFFAQSRLGTKGLTIVNQGDSDIFVRSSARDRRAMLEEILGLRQYQLKKHDAELKLKNTRFNMEKAKALVEEILPRLRLLRRQTAKWEKHDELVNELSNLEKIYFGIKLAQLKTERERVMPEMNSHDEALQGLAKELAEREKELKSVEAKSPKSGDEYLTWQKDRDTLFAKKSELQKTLGRIEAKIELGGERVHGSKDSEEMVRLLEETRETLEDAMYESDARVVKNLLKQLFEKINHLLDSGTNEAAGFGTPNREIEEERNTLLEQVRAIDEDLAKISAQEEKRNTGFADFNTEFRKAFAAVEEKKNERNKIEAAKNRILFEEERVKIREQELTHYAEQIGRSLKDFSPIEESHDVVKTERDMLRIRGELASIGEIDEAVIKEAKEADERYTFLSTQLLDLEKAFTDLTNLIHDLDDKIHNDFTEALKAMNHEFQTYFHTMFGGGTAKLVLEKPRPQTLTEGEGEVVLPGDGDDTHSQDHGGIEIAVSLPRKRISGLDMLSGGEKTLVSVAALFALISVSPPPFLVLDEIDAPLDEANARRFASIVKEFSGKTQFLIVTHNRATMESADLLYGVTMGEDGTSKVLSLKME
ncbi:MAG: AAA family ATPase [Patescibacteria group bacterium]